MTKDAFREAFANHEADIKNIVDPLIDYSFDMIEDDNEFMPHGAVISTSGDVQLVNIAQSDGSNVGTPPQILRALHEGLRNQVSENDLRGVATAEQVQVEIDGADTATAVKVVFESRDDFCMTVYVPYKHTDSGKVEIEPAVLSATEPTIIKTGWSA